MTTFTTTTEAETNGFVRASKFRTTYRGFEIKSSDISGRKSFGYDYAIKVFPLLNTPDTIPFNIFMDTRFAATITVWLTESVNKIGSKGACLPMYTPADFKTGLDSAKQFIDNLYAEYPILVEHELELEAKSIAKSERYHAKQIKRAHKLAAKYGAANLSAEWKLLLA